MERHIPYEAGSLPLIIDISNRSMELSISPHVTLHSKVDFRKGWYSSLEFERTNVLRMTPRVSVSTERIAPTPTKRWMFVVCSFICCVLFFSGFDLFSEWAEHSESCQSRVSSALLIFCSRYSFFFFTFPAIARLAECIKNGTFQISSEHIESLNKAYDRCNGCVYLFVSLQSSKLIHVLDWFVLNRRVCVWWRTASRKITSSRSPSLSSGWRWSTCRSECLTTAVERWECENEA